MPTFRINNSALKYQRTLLMFIAPATLIYMFGIPYVMGQFKISELSETGLLVLAMLAIACILNFFRAMALKNYSASIIQDKLEIDRGMSIKAIPLKKIREVIVRKNSGKTMSLKVKTAKRSTHINRLENEDQFIEALKNEIGAEKITIKNSRLDAVQINLVAIGLVGLILPIIEYADYLEFGSYGEYALERSLIGLCMVIAALLIVLSPFSKKYGQSGKRSEKWISGIILATLFTLSAVIL